MPPTLDNQALVFIKPHAAGSPAVARFVRETLERRGAHIAAEGCLDGETIRRRGIVENHYAAIAAFALQRDPLDVPVSAEKRAAIEAAAGVPWAPGSVLHAAACQEAMGLSAAELNTAWERSRYVKLAPGLYAAKIQVPGHPPRITVNGFFPRLRERFVLPDARVLWYDVRFSPARLPWREFRRDAVGATNPAEAAPGSIREALFREPDRFGLPEKPTVQLNGVHASAGPLEGARERRIWLENRAGDSELVAALRQGEVPEGRIRELLDNGPMTWKGVTAPAFDLLEDVDAPVALERILEACRATA